MRILAVTCEVLSRAVYLAAARSPHTVDVVLNARGLHDRPVGLREVLQAAIDDASKSYDAIVLAYGLCGSALDGLIARHIPVVIPRAHDCITLFLGNRARYAAEAAANPGTYWYVQDYLERSDAQGAFAGLGANSDAAARATHEEYVAKYGQDNADYLMEVMGAWQAHYDRAAFIDLGIGDSSATRRRAIDEAETRGWRFEQIEGSLVLVRHLIEGDWGLDEFLVLRPDEQLAMSYDSAVIRAVALADRSSRS